MVSVTDESCLGLSRWLEDDWAPETPPAPKTTTTTRIASTSQLPKTVATVTSTSISRTRSHLAAASTRTIPGDELIRTVTGTPIKPTQIPATEEASAVSAMAALNALIYLTVLAAASLAYLA